MYYSINGPENTPGIKIGLAIRSKKCPICKPGAPCFCEEKNIFSQCPATYNPVCGSNGKTYFSPCEAGSISYTSGPCKTISPEDYALMIEREKKAASLEIAKIKEDYKKKSSIISPFIAISIGLALASSLFYWGLND